MATKKFFEERSDRSEVKARIVQKYFSVWARIIMPTAEKHGGRIAYIDLYAGPGRYKDGAASTPLLVLQEAVKDKRLSRMLVTLFNDANPEHASALQSEINKLPGIKNLKYPPEISHNEVDEDAEEHFSSTNLIPSFTFFDPFGYKGMSLGIIDAVVKDWGCDCVFFFNYDRINRDISNPVVADHMDALFGKSRADKLRNQLPLLKPGNRENLILEELAQAIKEKGKKFVLPFRFKNSRGSRTSHSLIFVSKKFKGYSIMKDIMAKESSTTEQGVPSLTYSPADASMNLLFSLSRPLDDLRGDLLKAFAGRESSLNQIYEEHSVDTPYVEKNYRDTLKALEKDNIISARSSTGKRVKETYPKHVLIKFPKDPSHGQ